MFEVFVFSITETGLEILDLCLLRKQKSWKKRKFNTIKVSKQQQRWDSPRESCTNGLQCIFLNSHGSRDLNRKWLVYKNWLKIVPGKIEFVESLLFFKWIFFLILCLPDDGSFKFKTLQHLNQKWTNFEQTFNNFPNLFLRLENLKFNQSSAGKKKTFVQIYQIACSTFIVLSIPNIPFFMVP